MSFADITIAPMSVAVIKYDESVGRWEPNARGRLMQAAFALYGERGTGPLIILSQVVLSLQLPFAVFPLVVFTSDRAKMGPFVNPPWVKLLAWGVAVIIAMLNVWLLYLTFA